MNTSESTLSLEKQYLIASIEENLKSLLAEQQATIEVEESRIIFKCPDRRSAALLMSGLESNYSDFVTFIDKNPALHRFKTVVYSWPGYGVTERELPLRIAD